MFVFILSYFFTKINTKITNTKDGLIIHKTFKIVFTICIIILYKRSAQREIDKPSVGGKIEIERPWRD